MSRDEPPMAGEDVVPPPPCAMVIFGAMGDLTKRLVVPALYNLVAAKRLPDGFQLVGVDLAAKDSDDWRSGLTQMMGELATDKDGEAEIAQIDPSSWRWLTDRMTYFRGDLSDPEMYKQLGELLTGLDQTKGCAGNRLFYLAIADRLFGAAIAGLGAAGLTTEEAGQWRRVIVEKPFGHDLASARALNAGILRTLKEEQVYRIDHFLGKETVQNIMALRFANGLFEPIWNRDHIDHIQITAAETVGVERRGKFYEKTGALRDMVPNHMFQLLAMTAMEPPTSFSADAIRSKKAEIVQSILKYDAAAVLKNAVRGQYGAGTVLGKPVQPYRQEPDVAPGSAIETYFACKLAIDNWRWAGVPFYLRTGKCLGHRRTEIAIRFHQAPYSIFRETPVERMSSNWMILRIQPDEGIALEFTAKTPGPAIRLRPVCMDFAYKNFFEPAPDTGYETLIYDCMIGDPTLFQRADNVEAGWAAVQPILDTWAEEPLGDFPNYAAGSDGPKSADTLLARDGRAWRALA